MNNEDSPFYDEFKGLLLPSLTAAKINNPAAIADLVLQVFHRNYSGQLLYIPKNGSEYRQRMLERNRQIKALYDAGISPHEIAQRFRLSRARVLDIASDQKKPTA